MEQSPEDWAKIEFPEESIRATIKRYLAGEFPPHMEYKDSEDALYWMVRTIEKQSFEKGIIQVRGDLYRALGARWWNINGL